MEDWVKDAINKYRFSDYLFKKKYDKMRQDFMNIIFIWEEDEDMLLAFRPIASDRMDPTQLEKLVAPYFRGRFEYKYAKLYGPKDVQGHRSRQIVHNMLLPNEIEHGNVALGPEDASGDWSIMLVIKNFEKQPINAVYNLLRDFDQKADQIMSVADDAFWSSVAGKKYAAELEKEWPAEGA